MSNDKCGQTKQTYYEWLPRMNFVLCKRK